MPEKWDFWIDRGGTFTDVVARRPEGGYLSHKLLSENPEQYPDAALQGIRDLLGVAKADPIPTERIAAVKMGTTVGTNALLERKGDRTLLVINDGFHDALRIGYQTRPHLFELNIQLPEMLYERVLEVTGRYTAHGEERAPLDLDSARAGLQAAFDAGIRACAIVFMHGYRFPAHEKAVAEAAREIGFTQISTSHQVSPLMKLVGRGDTTVVDAYLSPILRRYVDQVAAELGDTRLMFMQSNGGLTDASLFQGKDCILSGPAGGVVGAVRTTAMAGFEKIIGFDMGGTSTDVSHYAGDFERAFESEVAGIRMRAPMMHIHTVAAGGGSILHYDGSRFTVGPDSAGANPGPACYRRGGPLAVTDCNVMLGKLNPDYFPKVFGPNGDEPLSRDAVAEKFAALAAEIEASGREPMTVEAIAEGYLTIAVENMANAIKKISIQRGYDVSEYVLSCFGGAGGQHACLVADALGMKKVFIHPLAGVLSAYGMGLADVRAMRERAVEAILDQGQMSALASSLDELAAEGLEELLGQDIDPARISVLRKVHLRYQGTDTALVVNFTDLAGIIATFEEAHRQQFGFIDQSKAHVVEAVSIEAVGAGEPAVDTPLDTAGGGRVDSIPPLASVQTYMAGVYHDAPVIDRNHMRPGDKVSGPAILREDTATTVIEPGWQAAMTDVGHLVLTRIQPLPKRVAVGTDVDPVMLEIFNNLFMSTAEQMGLVLQKTTNSVNIKERLDFSCAVFDRDGELIANAPHIPVHLGSMDESIKAVIRVHGAVMRPGDVFVLNAPYNGGTHLPDVTVITPVFNNDDAGEAATVLFYLASRGHHAEIGGISPGSMPPNSRTVEEEGILIDNIKLVDQGRFLETEMRYLLASGPYPSRNPDSNIADLKAQIAACEKGVQELRRVVEHFGLDVVYAYMGHVQDNAEESVRRVIDVLQTGSFEVPLDNGSKIHVDVSIDHGARAAKIDFTGTSAQLDTNFNAPTAVCRSAVLYVFRTLVDGNIPLNAGCLKPIQIIIPDDCMLNPKYPAAVVAGNVETSQNIVDCLYGALGRLAACQGTMNNFTFGDNELQYYETICSGTPAGPGFHGTDAVHAHMTNSRLTDPEVLEWRFPVMLDSFGIRSNSGGKGAFNGGSGILRRVRFLAPMTASILSCRRIVPPHGIAGGGDGEPGRCWVERADGGQEELSGCDSAEMTPEDVFVIQTPTGGAYGEAGS
ncbi:MAG: hydantoinase B/oxoprolinase family protein [Alphaproteobacteria bacterium]|jgi:5-oxoprolinase (ATP-hydrolysing)|nr:5-oxoprolinase [Rhodospirillaceae bacterium]MDP6255678.1 hydantoinase B/oxoprolinase family protein [Alphaproteobacteria bacterium]MDP7229474.1 hydantoinase B/oxoprolinase family protein [Alphaproteobacteria bacterium]HJM94291.1 hydantoinase B/oxoprolinase family protein [Alphaproteobacteria bacterium]